MPPFGFLPALALSLTVAVWLLDGAATGGATPAPPRRSDLGRRSPAGAWGFGYFVAGLWWLGSAFLVEADQFAWALPFGVLGLPALLAVFPAFGFALARLSGPPAPGGSSRFAFGLTRRANGCAAILFTGFPVEHARHGARPEPLADAGAPRWSGSTA